MLECVSLTVDGDGPNSVVRFDCSGSTGDPDHDIVIQRDPRWERRRPRAEHGPRVGLGRGAPDQRLVRLRLNGRAVAIETQSGIVERDCRRIDDGTWVQMRRLLERMNFDHSFELASV